MHKCILCACGAGERGDVAEAKGAAGQAPAWVLPAGLLEYVHVPGHSPGHVAFLHRPSSSLLPADVIVNIGGGGYFGLHTPPKLGLPPAGAPGSSLQISVPPEVAAALGCE